MFFKLKSRLRAFLAKQRATSEPERTEQALTMLRIIAGGFMIPHGISALTGGGQSMAVIALTRNGFEPSSMAIWFIVFLELIGGVCVLVGLFTRVFAAALAIEMLWVIRTFWSNRSDWDAGLWEFPLTMSILMFAVALCGGGRWSLDRKLGMN